ncbi:MAG: hypothetical protein ABI123_01220 [Ginsengibacter sp.]|jgi:hypothetical protein
MEENKEKDVSQKDANPENNHEVNKRLEDKIDAELEDSFPASDPPSYSQPGNDDIKRNT